MPKVPKSDTIKKPKVPKNRDMNLSKVTIFGIDPAPNHTGIVCLNGTGKLNWSSQIRVHKDMDTMDKLLYWESYFQELFKHILDTTMCFIGTERHAWTPQMSKDVILLYGQFLGVLYMKMYNNLVYFNTQWYAPTQIKKFITGSGRSEKDTVLQQVLSKYHHELKTTDEGDAFGMATIRLESMKLENGITELKDYPKYQQEVLKKVLSQTI